VRGVNAVPAFLLCGCALHAVGYVASSEDAIELLHADGRTTPLVLIGEEAEPIEKLDGWLLELDGQRRIDGGLRVRSWRAIEGPHGVSAWVGPVQSYGSVVGVYDVQSDTVYGLDEASASRLRGMPGAKVAVEAWVTGTHTLYVIHLVILDP
jgi:hypothetical protein